MRAQIHNAALNAWILIKKIEAVRNLPTVHDSVRNRTPADGSFVAIYIKTSKRHIPASFGYLVDLSCMPEVNRDDAKKRKLRAVKIVEVQIPGMLLDCHNGTEETTLLESFGDVPFVALLEISCLRTYSEQVYIQDKAEKELAASADRSEILAPTAENGSQDNDITVPSKILKDAFHIMQMIRVSLKHGMAKDFIRRFRDALFVVDPDDKRKVEEYLVSVGTDWKTKLLADPKYIFQQVKRWIPPASGLLPVVELLFQKNMETPFVFILEGDCSMMMHGKMQRLCWKKFG